VPTVAEPRFPACVSLCVGHRAGIVTAVRGHE
jgi:hypothetical protein